MQLVNKLNSYYTNIVRLLQRSRSKIRIINSTAPDSEISKQNIDSYKNYLSTERKSNWRKPVTETFASFCNSTCRRDVKIVFRKIST